MQCSLSFKAKLARSSSTFSGSRHTPLTSRINRVNRLNKPISNSTNKQNKSLRISYEHIHWRDITEKAGIIGNDSPYLPDEELMKIKYKEGKKKWMSKNGFNSCVGKATTNRSFVIKNYVQMTPSKPPVLYNFRSVEKNKWMSKEGFSLY